MAFLQNWRKVPLNKPPLRFTFAPVLAHTDLSFPFVVEMDVSSTIIGALTLARFETGPEPLFSARSFQCKKIMRFWIASSWPSEKWQCCLACHRVQVFMDHKDLEYFQKDKTLNQKQVH